MMACWQIATMASLIKRMGSPFWCIQYRQAKTVALEVLLHPSDLEEPPPEPKSPTISTAGSKADSVLPPATLATGLVDVPGLLLPDQEGELMV
jgi:hypothetical protein